jgi:hypothetical protein
MTDTDVIATEVELECAVYGEGTVFPVKIARNAKVSALQKAIFDDQRYHERFSFPSSAVTLYLARKNGAWLKDDDNVEDLLLGTIDTAYKKMRPSWKITKPELLGPNFQAGEEEIQVLVELPEAAAGVASGDRESASIDQVDMSSTPHPHRLERWNKINRILARNNKKKARTNEEGFTTPYSSSRWTAVGPVFDDDRVKYAEAIRPIPANDLEVLSKVLTWIMKCFEWTLIDVKDNEAKRLHVIAPILWAVVQLLPDVKIFIEQDLDGNRVDAHGHFEFVLMRGNKRVCIVEAKEEKFKQGMAQALLGCEVAADLDHSHEVYAVVTNAAQWIFLKSLDEEILCDEFNALTFDENGSPHAAQLKEVTGKLYSMLRNNDH